VVRVLAIVLLVACCGVPAAASEPGINLAFGRGPAFAGNGISVGFGFALDNQLRLTPYVSGGAIIDPYLSGTEGGLRLHPAAGLLTSVGEHHRVVIDLTYGFVGRDYLYLYGYRFARSLWGPSALVGYGYATKTGFLVRAEIGASYRATPYAPERHPLAPTFCIAAGKTF
jgi:hypothetical protein